MTINSRALLRALREDQPPDRLRGAETHLRGGAAGPHAPCVGAAISLQQPLVVLRGGHGRHGPPIGEAQTLHRRQKSPLTSHPGSTKFINKGSVNPNFSYRELSFFKVKRVKTQP